MKNKDACNRLKERFTSIRTAIEKMQSATDSAIYSCATKNAEFVKKYSKEYGAEMRSELLAKTSAAVLKEKQKCRQTVDRDFSQIRQIIRAWTFQPIPPEVSVTLDTITRNQLKLSRAELEVLSELTQGCYIGEKIVDGLAKQDGLFDSGFIAIDDIYKSIRQAEDVIDRAIENYSGQLDENNKLLSNMLGLSLSEDAWFIPMSATVLTDDNAFSRAETMLSTVTESTFELLPSRRAEIDAMFADRTEDERLEIIQAAIDAEDTESLDNFRLYDQALYSRAEKNLALYHLEQMKEASLARTAATAKAAEARGKLDTLIKASTEAESA